MEKNSLWPLLAFATSDQRLNRQMQRARQAGQLRELAPRVYTSDLETPPAALVRRHWFQVLGHLYPQAVISHRSGLDAQPTPAGDIFLTYKPKLRSRVGAKKVCSAWKRLGLKYSTPSNPAHHDRTDRRNVLVPR